MRRNIVLIGIASIVAFIGIYIGFRPERPVRPAPLERVIVRLAWLHQAQFAGMYVAQEKGFYRAAGLDVEFRAYESKLDQGQELQRGDTTFSIMNPFEVIAATARGANIRAVAALYAISPYAFATRTSAAIKTPADFRGKVLGLPAGAIQGELTYGALLRRFAVATTTVRFQSLDFDAVDAFIQQRVDVVPIYRTNEVYRLDAQNVAYDLVLPERYGFEVYGDVIAANAALIEQRPDLVRKFVRATLDGWEYALTHVNEALAATARYEHASYNDPAHERFILTKSLPLMKPSASYRIGDMHFAVWNRAYSAMREAGIVTGYIDVSRLYTTAFLKP